MSQRRYQKGNKKVHCNEWKWRYYVPKLMGTASAVLREDSCECLYLKKKKYLKSII